MGLRDRIGGGSGVRDGVRDRDSVGVGVGVGVGVNIAGAENPKRHDGAGAVVEATCARGVAVITAQPG